MRLRLTFLCGAFLVSSRLALAQPAEPAPPPPAAPPPAPPAAPPSEAPPSEAPPSEGSAPAPDAPPAEPAPPPAAPAPAPEPPPAAPAPSAAPPEPVAPATAPEPPPAPPAPPEPVEITVAGARASRAPGSVQVIGRKQLERFEYDDALPILMQVPGVYVRQEDGVGLRPNLGIRGGNPDRSKKLTLMEDGVLFGPAPYSAPAAYYFPLVSRMVQVKVIKGPSAIAFGPQTVGGAVDFVTRPIPSRPSFGLDVGVGQYGYDKAHVYAGTSNEQFGFLFEYLRIHNTGFKSLPNADADTGATRNDWMAKASYVIDPTARNRQELGLKLSYSDERSNETYLGLTDADFHADPNRRYAASALDEMNNHRIGFTLSHQLSVPSQQLKVLTQVYRHDYQRIWRKLNRFGGANVLGVLRDPTLPQNAELLAVLRGEQDSATGSDSLWIGPNNRTFVSQGIQTQVELSARTGALTHSVQAGARLHYDSIERRHSEDQFLMEGGTLVPAGSPTLVTVANFEKTTAVALHALDAITWRRLTLTPGVRVELISSSSEDRKLRDRTTAFKPAVLPGMGAYYALTERFGVLAGAYRGFSPPPPGDSKARTEYSINYEAGARYSSGPRRLELIGFFNDYSNLTDICTLSSSCADSQLDKQFSAGRAHIYGLEAFGSYELRVGDVRFPATLAYTFTRSQFRTSFSSPDPIYGDVTRGDQLPYIPRHQGSLTLGAETDWGGAALAAYYVGRMREEASSGSIDTVLATEAQKFADLSVFFKPLSALSIYANLRNITGEQFIVGRRPFGARPNPPRWLQVGAKLTF